MNPIERSSLAIDAAGWCHPAQHRPSPNFDVRPASVDIDLLVIHNISLPPGQFGGSYIADLFGNCLDCDVHPYFDQLRDLRVSAHFLIHRDGSLAQFVSADARAWHAGVSSFDGRERCNDFSIGIELEGSDFVPFDERQYRTLADLTAALRQRYPLRAVTGHEHVAPGRKTDPGPFFDWDAYCSLVRQCEKADGDSAPLRFPPLEASRS
ncbi:1,6-anhydro-N-acetylmuramyl-L-alanine amidase AmpD [Noviherbaspirillum sedimenti]|uniref:1,6-anhydro-N-acetylmuramyl-L-alanine amidase AmpD n=1 Tax=Noviherbaspirillum sedimenti TaxID=2320865 RepID=A0A3A3G7D5_9BURK|nr:1,6-anhydro-N-acetylmuramyl-L-alanine amidase AmpD [Noviherbaspirillum sedimenti]RJG03734.1 1,6-anhydro-N-acetylmuramyl-L-alanine amidase AmpD [Noviherbaspirillum sedimenti]